MFNLQGKKRSEYSDDDLARLERTLEDYWDKSRDLESHTVNDLEKHLWLANGAAATATIGFIQARSVVPWTQYTGAWLFVLGILCLVALKYVSATNASRDRYRFQGAKSRFDAEEVTDDVFRGIEDRTFHILKRSYLLLQWSSGAAFILGAVFTLVGVACAI